MTASRPNDEAIFHAARDIPDPDRRRWWWAFARAWLWREVERATAPASWAADRPAGRPKRCVRFRCPAARYLVEQHAEGALACQGVAPVTEPTPPEVTRPGGSSKKFARSTGGFRTEGPWSREAGGP
jgi:hypothetical protein